MATTNNQPTTPDPAVAATTTERISRNGEKVPKTPLPAVKEPVEHTPQTQRKAPDADTSSSIFTKREESGIDLGEETQGRWLSLVLPKVLLGELLPLAKIDTAKEEMNFEPFGSATRPFLAGTNKIVIAKDYKHSTGLDFSNGDIYWKLKDKNLQHIPPFGHGNDVPGQLTIDLSKHEWVSKVQQHYRMSHVVGIWLERFMPTKILVAAVADALEGHDRAYFDANILHRDISMSNIMIAKGQGRDHAVDGQEVGTVEKHRGTLVDWDLSVDTNVTDSQLRTERAGTSPFISAALLARIVKHHSIEDDQESSFYTILWQALRFRKCSAELTMFEHGFPTGGWLKRYMLVQLPYPIEFNPPLDKIINGALAFFRPRYTSVSEEEENACEQLQLMKNAGVPQDLIDMHPVARHHAGLARMKEKGAWVTFLRQHLEEPGWPDNDFGEHMFGTEPDF